MQKTVSRCLAVLRQLRSIRHSVPATTFQTLIVSLVLSRLDYGNAVLAGLPAYLFRRLTVDDERGSTTHLRPASLRPHLRRTHQPPLAPGSGESAVQDSRAHVQGHSWNCAVIPESTGSCRRSAWSTFPPLCSDQSSAGAVPPVKLSTVGGRAFPVSGPTI